MTAPLSRTKQGLLGVGLGLLAVLGPLTPRAFFGTLPPGYYGCSLVIYTCILGLAVSLVLWVTARLERRGVGLRASIFLGLLATVPLIVLSYLLILAVAETFPSLPLLDPTEPRNALFHLATGLGDSLPMLAVWSGLIFLPQALRANEERSAEIALLRHEAELLRLRSHLEPHFVLNTLNAIAGLLGDEPEKAQELLASLGDLFRDATGFREVHQLRNEIAWLERYAAIHELRHGERLEFSWDIAEEARDITCPTLLLQPLVENAIMHGALKRERGRVRVAAVRQGDRLRIEISDDGPSLGPRRSLGKGLSIVERRLALEGAAEGSFSLERRGEWTVATLLLPAASSPEETP